MTIKELAHVSTLVGLSSLLGLSLLTPAALAKPAEVSPLKSEQAVGTLRQGLPGRRLGGGTRGERIFAAEYSYLAALTLPNNLSITADEKPTLLFYIPAMVNEQTGELALRDEQDNLVHESTFQIDSEGGIVSLDTAEDAAMPVLVPNETYRWYFSIVPEATDRANDVVVHGNIRRVEAAAWLTEQAVDSAQLARLAIENPLMQARMLYQQTNRWHDAAVILNELRQDRPSDAAIAAEWDQLIEVAGLTAIIGMPEPDVQIGWN